METVSEPIKVRRLERGDVFFLHARKSHVPHLCEIVKGKKRKKRKEAVTFSLGCSHVTHLSHIPPVLRIALLTNNLIIKHAST